MKSTRRRGNGLKGRRGEHRKLARATLEYWRGKVLKERYPHCSYTAVAILPDKVLSRLAAYVHRTMDDVSQMGLLWALASVHGGEVLQLLKSVDDDQE